MDADPGRGRLDGIGGNPELRACIEANVTEEQARAFAVGMFGDDPPESVVTSLTTCFR